MRIPENAISTKHKKRRINLLDKIPGGFFIVLLLFAIWGGGALLGVWIEGIHPKDRSSADQVKTTELIDVEPNQAGEQSASPQVADQKTPSEILNFEVGIAAPIYEAERLKAYVLGLNPKTAYQLSVCNNDKGDGGVFSSLSFSRGAKVAAVFQSIEPRLKLQVQSQAVCTAGIEVKSIALNKDAKPLAMRIELSANLIRPSEQVFFEQVFNRLLVTEYRLLMISYGGGDLADKLAERLINQGFKPEQIELVRGPILNEGESANYLMAYMVPKAQTTNN